MFVMFLRQALFASMSLVMTCQLHVFVASSSELLIATVVRCNVEFDWLNKEPALTKIWLDGLVRSLFTCHFTTILATVFCFRITVTCILIENAIKVIQVRALLRGIVM